MSMIVDGQDRGARGGTRRFPMRRRAAESQSLADGDGAASEARENPSRRQLLSVAAGAAISGGVLVADGARRPASAAPASGAILPGTYVEREGAQVVPALLTFTGGTPWWEATSLSSLQSSIAAAANAGGGEVRVTVPIALGDASVIVPNGVNLWCAGRGRFTSNTMGVAITFDGQEMGRSRIRITRDRVSGGQFGQDVAWAAGIDKTSVGIRLRNCSWSTYDIVELFNFETGLELLGAAGAADAGTAYCHINIGRITNNRRNIRFSATTTGAGEGYANGNSFNGGAVRHDGGLVGSYAGTRGIDLSKTGNGNTFTGVNLEGGAVEKTVEVQSGDNVFVGCRLESARKVHFLAGSRGNMVIGGYGNLGPDVAPFQDDSLAGANCVWGSRGVNFLGDGGAYGPTAALTVRALRSASDKLIRTVNASGEETMNVDGGGRIRHLVPGEAHERLRVDQYGGTAGYGALRAGRGNVAPDAELGRSAGNAAGWLANCGVGMFGAEPPAAKPAAPTDLAGVIALLRSYGMCA